jgi:[amino group carrier protein]-lysine/ornithine hydrolase
LRKGRGWARGTSARALKLLRGSLAVYSPSGEESSFASFLSEQMRDLGYRNVRKDSAGNVVGEMGEGRTTVLLCGHMDTVPGPLPVRSSRGVIHGRGASDAKSPLCALLVAGALSADAGVKVTMAGAVREETDSYGAAVLSRELPPQTFAIFGEPGGASRATVAYRGRASFHLEVRTGGGHAGAPWAHASAFDEFEKILARLRGLGMKTRAREGFRAVSVSPTMVSAGSFHNVIPNLCEATIDVRVPPPLRTSQVVSELRKASWGGEGSKVKCWADSAVEPCETNPNSKVVRALQRGIISRIGTKPSLVRKTGTGDMNAFATGAPSTESVTYGPGMPGTSHTDSEAVLVSDYLDSIAVLKSALEYLGSAGA